MIRILRTPTLGVVALLGVTAIAAAAVSANRPPKFLPGSVTVTWNNDYDIIYGVPKITAQTAKIKLARGATDPDGHRLTYRWTATNGKISGRGLRATWVRVVPAPDQIKPGVVTVTALDGHGGRAQRKIVFK